MTTHEWTMIRNKFIRMLSDYQKEHKLSEAFTKHLLTEALFIHTHEDARAEWEADKRRSHFAQAEPPSSGGYINQYGIRVPNPCGEVDTKGRDLSRFHRNVRFAAGWDDEMIDAVLADPDNK